MIQINMDIPKSCWHCKVEQLTHDCPCNLGYADSIDYKNKRHPDCPLIEVETAQVNKHGMYTDTVPREVVRRIISSPRSKQQMLWMLASIPTAEKTGRWITSVSECHDNPELLKKCLKGYLCSECKEPNDFRRTRYCPNCGIKMENYLKNDK